MKAEILHVATVYENWMKVLHVRLKAGGDEFGRDVEDHGNAVAILPYDADRRVVLLGRQLRVPVLLSSGESNLLEAPAGLTEGERPSDAAARELNEELGLRVEALEHVGGAWTSPGVSTEWMDLYLARYSPADRVSSGGGVPSEHEVITPVELPTTELWRQVEQRQLSDMKTLALALLLRAHHGELFESPARGR
jgi:nudix-type nucleoside diphosphatase (YffH/AdpP family)